MEYIKKYRKILLSIAIVLIIAIVYYSIFGIYYETNDDSTMASIIYGYATGKNEPHIVYVNVLIGYLCIALLNIFPTIAWYGVIQYLLIIISSIVFVYLLIDKFEFKVGLLISIIIFLFFGYNIFCLIQFTKTAAFITIAGILLLYNAINKKKYFCLKFVVSFILVLFGSMYRFNSFLQCLALLGIVGIIYLVNGIKKKNNKYLIKLVVSFLIVFSGCLIAKQCNINAYKSEEWSEYRKINNYRSDVMDYSIKPYEGNESFYNSIGIDEYAYRMINFWNFGDPEVFNEEVFKSIAESASMKSSPNMDIKHLAYVAFTLCKKFWYYVLPALLFFIICLKNIIIAKDKKKLLLLSVFTIITVFIELFLYYLGRYSLNRLQFVVFFEYLIMILLYIFDSKINIKYKYLIIITCILAILSSYRNIRYWKKNNALEKSVSMSSEITQIEADNKDINFINISKRKVLNNVFEVKDKGIYNNILITGGWRYLSPIYFDAIESNGIDNPYKYAVDNKKLMIVSTANIEYLVNYVNDRYTNEKVYGVNLKMLYGYKFYSLLKELDYEDIKEYSTDLSDIKLNYKKFGDFYCGTIYKKNFNSLKSNLIIESIESDGTTNIKYSCLYENKNDINNGLFSGFCFNSDAEIINIYLETDGVLHKVNIEGSIDEK